MNILKKVYPKYLSLCEYLETSGCQNFLQSSDKAGFHSFVQTTIVAEYPGSPQIEGPVDTKPCSQQTAVITKAIEILKTCGVPKPNNVLLFEDSAVNSAQISGKKSLLVMPHWQLLLSRIGEEVMLPLLLNKSIFLFVPQSCYFQLCGLPIYDLISRHGQILTSDGNTWSEMKLSRRAFTMISVCYQRQGGGKLIKKHPLECLSASNNSARILMRTIFTDDVPKKLIKCSKTKIQRTPRRFIPLQELLKELLMAHKKTKILAFLECHCPLLRSGQVEGQVTLQALLHNTVEPWRVFLFLRGFLLRAIPFPVWGSLHNRQAFFKFVRRFIKLGRNEKLEITELMKKMRIGDCEWTQLKKLRGRSPCRSDVLMQRRMVTSLMAWLMSEYVMALIKSAFYITETSSSRNGVVYYRKATWNRLEKVGLEQCITSGNLKHVPHKLGDRVVTSNASYGCSTLRFIPKTNGLRPITNMNKKAAGKSLGFSINNMLEDSYDILKFYRTERPSLFGSSIMSVNEAYEKWKRFVTKTRRSNCRPLYFVKADIAQCYDSIPHEALFDVVQNLILPQGMDPKFLIFRYAMVTRGRGVHALRKSFLRHTHREGSKGIHLTFLETMLKGAKDRKWKNAVLVNRVSSHLTSTKNVMSSIKKHVRCGVVKFGGRFYTRRNGIPQGSIISSWLCNYFYAAMETSCLPHPRQDEFLIRLLDDFLFVSHDQQRATNFLQVLLSGLPQYGCHVNPSKTLTNFPFEYEGRQVQSTAPSEPFPWCGLLLNTETLEVCNDYTRYKDVRIRYTLALDYTGNIFKKIKSKLIQALQAKCMGFFLDPQMNYLGTVRKNYYEMMLMSAFRFHSQLRVVPHECMMGVNATRRLFGVIVKLAKKLHRLGLPLKQSETEWMCLKAFETKLRLHHSRYRRLLKLINKTMIRLTRHMVQRDMEEVQRASTPAIPQAFTDMRT